MHKYLFYLILLSFSNLHSQNFDGYVVTNSNDTINCVFEVDTNIFDKTMFYPTSVLRRVNIVNSNGEKVNYFPNQLKSFFIKNTSHGDYKFVSTSADNYKQFYQEIVSGKLSYFKSYFHNIQGGGFPHEKSFFCKDNKLSSREPNFFNFRNWLGKLIEDYPELHQKWMDSDNFYKKNQYLEVIELYNDHFEK